MAIDLEFDSYELSADLKDRIYKRTMELIVDVRQCAPTNIGAVGTFRYSTDEIGFDVNMNGRNYRLWCSKYHFSGYVEWGSWDRNKLKFSEIRFGDEEMKALRAAMQETNKILHTTTVEGRAVVAQERAAKKLKKLESLLKFY